MDRLIFVFVILIVVIVYVRVAFPSFWSYGDLPYEDDDPTRGDWKTHPDQGHPEDH